MFIQKRPTCISKGTLPIDGLGTLLLEHKRPTFTPKEANVQNKRDLHSYQKRPTLKSKGMLPINGF